MRRRFRIGRRTPSDICERCGTDQHVHRGLCHRCRDTVGDSQAPGAARHVAHQATVEPPHNPPWRRRGA